MADPRVNKIRIKTGVLKRYSNYLNNKKKINIESLLHHQRLVKEKSAYEKELEHEKKRLETMKKENKNIYEINKQVCMHV